jgi:tetratricopeptide (TPR) repeat protein
MNQPQKLEAIIKHLRAGEAKMKDNDHIAFGMLCLFIFFFALMFLINGYLLTFTVLSSCLGLAIPLYYWITVLRNRRSWYWESVRREINGKDLRQMWNTSERGDWLLWFCAHMIGKPGWPTHQQVVFASCQCARLALRHIPPQQTRPLKAIETAEAWARGQATLEQVRDAGHAADALTGYGDTVYMAAQAAHAAAWAVYATEDGECFRLAQAASDAALRTAWAASYEISETQRERGDFTATADDARDRVEKETQRECAELVRRTLNVPNGLTNELPIYDWVKSWHRNSSGKRTGRMNHIPFAISRHSPDLERVKRELTRDRLSPALRIATVVMVFAAGWFLVGALERHPDTYYTNLRWLVCLTAVMLIWRGDIQKSLKWGYLLVPVAILFNPILPVHLHGERMDILRIWHTIDVATAAVLFLVLALMEVQLWLTKKRHNYPNFFKKSATEPTEKDQLWLEGYKAFERGQDLYFQNEVQQALQYFDTAIDSGFEGADLYNMRGGCLQSLKLDLDAIDDLTKAIELNPEDSNYYFMRSISKGHVGDLHGRVDDLNEAIRLAGIDSSSTRSHNAFAREKGYKDGVAGMYRMQMMHAKLELERQASDERRLQGPGASLGPDLVTKRQSEARRRTRH